jgi:hypothetical protein
LQVNKFILLIPTLFPVLLTAQYVDSAKKINQIDLIDIGRHITGNHSLREKDVIIGDNGKVHFGAFPAAGYTLQTGFAVVISGNAAFFTAPHNHETKNISTANVSIAYTSRNQIIFPIQSSVWTKFNKYNVVTDWRFLKYPSETFGLGGQTKQDSGYNLDYSYIKLHQAILKKLATKFYAGIGYDFDYFWNIREANPPKGHITDFENYGLHKSDVSSGISLNLLYDSRRNPINAQNGIYTNVIFRPKFIFLGSESDWQTLLVEFRDYYTFPSGSGNILAFWSYNWFTLGGKPPYLLLPSTGWDEFSNTGRGYIQGRFRGRNMLDQEAEYRFIIAHNGLFGGVVFANAESFSDFLTNKFEVISPGFGLGMRIKLNKFSGTNLALDYAWGTQGSKGFFVNLGEVF